jgi:hypothetical protein
MSAEAPRRKRASKRALRVWAALAGTAAFVLPWGVIRAIPAPVASSPAVQVVTIPSGAQVTVQNGGKGSVVRVVGGAPATSTAPVATTGGSHPVVR